MKCRHGPRHKKPRTCMQTVSDVQQYCGRRDKSRGGLAIARPASSASLATAMDVHVEVTPTDSYNHGLTCVCVRACVRALCVCVRARACFVCVCVCVCACVCVCMCVCVHRLLSARCATNNVAVTLVSNRHLSVQRPVSLS